MGGLGDITTSRSSECRSRSDGSRRTADNHSGQTVAAILSIGQYFLANNIGRMCRHLLRRPHHGVVRTSLPFCRGCRPDSGTAPPGPPRWSCRARRSRHAGPGRRALTPQGRPGSRCSATWRSHWGAFEGLLSRSRALVCWTLVREQVHAPTCGGLPTSNVGLRRGQPLQAEAVICDSPTNGRQHRRHSTRD